MAPFASGIPFPSFRRKPESRNGLPWRLRSWTPAFAGVTDEHEKARPRNGLSSLPSPGRGDGSPGCGAPFPSGPLPKEKAPAAGPGLCPVAGVPPLSRGTAPP